MLQPLPKVGATIWHLDVNEDLQYYPRPVVFDRVDFGLVWYTNSIGQHFGWYAEMFFHTENEAQQECERLNRVGDLAALKDAGNPIFDFASVRTLPDGTVEVAAAHKTVKEASKKMIAGDRLYRWTGERWNPYK